MSNTHLGQLKLYTLANTKTNSNTNTVCLSVYFACAFILSICNKFVCKFSFWSDWVI